MTETNEKNASETRLKAMALSSLLGETTAIGAETDSDTTTHVPELPLRAASASLSRRQPDADDVALALFALSQAPVVLSASGKSRQPPRARSYDTVVGVKQARTRDSMRSPLSPRLASVDDDDDSSATTSSSRHHTVDKHHHFFVGSHPNTPRDPNTIFTTSNTESSTLSGSTPRSTASEPSPRLETIASNLLTTARTSNEGGGRRKNIKSGSGGAKKPLRTSSAKSNSKHSKSRNPRVAVPPAAPTWSGGDATSFDDIERVPLPKSNSNSNRLVLSAERAPETTELIYFELVKQPKPKQRKSYRSENRYLAPNPFVVRYRRPGSVLSLSSEKSSTTAAATSKQLAECIPRGGSASVSLLDSSGRALPAPMQRELVGGARRSLSLTDKSAQASFSLKMHSTSRGELLRLAFDVEWLGADGAQRYERLLSDPFRVDTNIRRQKSDD
eukprot:CAMPEP_0168596050 /NCGR_PEP_ID=MMETSP0420-20121227/9814_1 /TAXON_ID=498008 /ORGANISM="Pessonella sp." /LENGTH=444 /DNA_ID=CAMNT_0008632589 /DNA_START=145 /DNA_END=1479 /DNA_ORIENTATION=+